MSGKYPIDHKLAADIIQLRTEQDLTNKQLANTFGVSTTFISKYVNDKLDHDPKDFTARAGDIIKGIRARFEIAGQLFETSVTRQMHGRINYIRETADIGLLYGPAGVGKTSGAQLYVERNPSTILVTLDARTRTDKQVESAVFNTIEHRDWKGNTSRTSYLTKRLAGSQRVVIFDNAQRPDGSGREWIFDFHDATQCPIVMIGNPEVLDKIKGNDQHFSRIGICPPAFKLQPGEIAAVSKKVAQQFSDEVTAEEVADLVSIIAKNDGHLRAVRKEIILTQAIRRLQNSVADKPRNALRMAHKELVRDYDLPL